MAVAVEAVELRIPPTADAVTHTFRTLVRLPAEDHGVFPGTLVKVAFVRGKVDRLVAPAEAIVRRGEVTGVYVKGDDGRINFRYVRVGIVTDGGRVPILSGVTAGEQVAVDPVAAAIAYKRQFASQGEAT